VRMHSQEQAEERLGSWGKRLGRGRAMKWWSARTVLIVEDEDNARKGYTSSFCALGLDVVGVARRKRRWRNLASYQRHADCDVELRG